MKITGIVILLLGVVGLLFSGVIAMQSETTAVGVTQSAARQDLTIPLVMGLAAIIGGCLILIFGGRGYVVLPRNPQTPQA